MTDGSTTIRRVLGILQRQKILIGAVLALFSSGTVLLLLLTPVLYSTSSLVLTTPLSSSPIIETGGNSNAHQNARTDNLVELAGSDRLLLALIERLNLAEEPEFLPETGVLDRVAGTLEALFSGTAKAQMQVQLPDATLLPGLREHVRIRRRGRSHVIEFTAQSQTPALAAALANTAAAIFLNLLISDRQDQINHELEALAKQKDQFDQELARAADAYDRSILVRARSLAREGHQEVTDILARITEADSLRRDIEEKVNAGSRRIDTASNGSSHPKRLLPAVRDQLNARLADASSRLRSLREHLRNTVLAADLPLSDLVGLYSDQQSILTASEQLEFARTRGKDLAAKQASAPFGSQIISKAVMPVEPSHPPVVLYIAIAGLFAIGASGTAAVFYETFVSGFVSESQIAETGLDIRSVSIPDVRDLAGSLSPADLPVEKPASPYSEAIRRLRMEIAFAGLKITHPPDRDCQLFLVTSALSGEGKTTLAVSLARLMAASGGKTLLLDGNLREPAAHDLLGLSPPLGIHDHLSGHRRAGDWRALLRIDPKTDLRILPGSGGRHLPADHLLSSSAFEDLLTELRREFDYIVIDTPATLSAVDAMLLANWADVAVQITTWAETRQKHCLKALDLIRTALPAGGKQLIVLNKRKDQNGDPSTYLH